MCSPIKVSVAMARPPRIAIAPTMIRMVLTALLFCLGGAGEGEGPVAAGDMRGGMAPPIGAPHLPQNAAPSLRLVPQELQNAIDHLGASITHGREEDDERESGNAHRAKRGAGSNLNLIP